MGCACWAIQTAEGVIELGVNVGSIYAEASLDIEKFKSAAAQMGAEGTKIASALDKAGAALDKAQMSIDRYSDGLDAAKASMAAAQSVFDSSAQTLEDLQYKMDEAAQKADRLEAAYRSAAATFGEGSAQAGSARDAYTEAASELDRLVIAEEKQQHVVDKNAVAFKKASNYVNEYERKLTSAKSTVADLNQRITGLNQQLMDESMQQAGVNIDSANASAFSFGTTLDKLASTTLTRASESMSTLAVKTAGFDTTSASGIFAARGLSSVMSMLAKTISGATLGYGALAAAAAYGGYKLYDFASGANAARDALAELNEKAQEWVDTNITTSFEKSKGLGGYGIDESTFAPVVSGGKSWMDELVKVWTDGKKETDQIVKDMVSGFTTETDTLRDSLTEIRDTAQSGGFAGEGFVGGLDADIARLGEIDSSIESILKKRQNGYFTEDDLAQLQTLVDEREALQIKYELVPEGATTGFDEIITNVRAQLSRGADSGTVFADAFTAASQGAQSYTDALNAEYDAQYKVIDLMEDGAEKTQALQSLQQWYTEQANAGVQAYAQALASAAQETGAFEEGGAYADSMEQVASAAQLMNKALADPSNENIEALSSALAGLDETQIVEMAASLSAMQAAGVEMSAGMESALDSISKLKYAAESGVFESISTELQTALSNMFGEGLDQEVLEIYPSINTEILTSVYDAWAAGEHADIIPGIKPEAIDPSAIVVDGFVTVAGKLGIIDNTTGVMKDANFKLGVNGELYQVDPTTGEISDTGYKVGVDGKVVHVDPTTGKITDTGWKFDVDGKLGYTDVSQAYTDGNIEGLTGTLSLVETDENTVLPEIVVDGVVRFTNVPESGVELEYNKGAGQVNQDSVFHVPSDTAETLEELATAVTSYNNAVSSGDSAAASAWLDSLQSTASALGTSLDAEDGAGFQELAQYVANGLQLLKDGALTEDEAAQLIATIENIQTILGSEIAVNASMTDTGVDLASGISEGMQQYGWYADASTIAQKIEDALRAATQTHSPSGMTKPIGTGLVDGISLGMLEATSVTDAAAQVSASILAAYQSKASATYSAGLNFSNGLARGIRAGRSAVISAAISVASAALQAAKSKLEIDSPSKVTQEYGEFFDLGFIEGIERMTPDVMRSIEDALAIEPPAYDVQRSIAQGKAAPLAIDYDRLADAMSQRQMVMTMNNRVVARVQARETAIAQNVRNKQIALGYGK